jgi:hypothetical protein
MGRVVIAVLCLLPIAALPVLPPGVPKADPLNPDHAVRLAAQFIATRAIHKSFKDQDLPYIRFLSWYDWPKERLEQDKLLLRWHLTQMTFLQGLQDPPHDVPETDGRLQWIDIRDYGWCQCAVNAVAERDFYIAEPWVDHEQAEFLRRALQVEPSPDALNGRSIQGPGGVQVRAFILATGTVLYAPQLLRDVLETDRVPSYYDLLYSAQRFPPGWEERDFEKREIVREWKSATFDWPGGDYRRPDGKLFPNLKPGYYKTDWQEDVEKVRKVKVRAPKFVDFPKDEADFDHAFGIDVAKAFAQKQQIDLDFGAVVEGGLDQPKGGSVVANHNRLLVTVQGPIGLRMETYDVKETSGIRDFAEVLIFQGKEFIPGQGARAVRDAGELLAYLPNSGQAALLVNGQNKRIEVADARFVNPQDLRMNIGLRTPGDCWRCHAPAGGYILPKDLVGQGLDDGIAIKFKEPAQRQRVKGFFLGWQLRAKAAQDPYLDLLQRATARPGVKGWTGAELAKNVGDFRNFYDDPVDAARAAATVGVPVEVLKVIAADKAAVFARFKQLTQGRSIPRRTFEIDVYPNLQIARQAAVNEAMRKQP